MCCNKDVLCMCCDIVCVYHQKHSEESVAGDSWSDWLESVSDDLSGVILACLFVHSSSSCWRGEGCFWQRQERTVQTPEDRDRERYEPHTGSFTNNRSGPCSQNIFRIKVAHNSPIQEKTLKITVSVLNVGLLNVCSKSISQSVLALKLAPKSVKG